MTRREKMTLAGGGLLLLILLLLLKRGGGAGSSVINNRGGFTLPGVTLPAFDFQPSTTAFQLPPMGADPMRLTMIGACCSDCSGAKPVSYLPGRSGPTFVTNEGAKGANIFINYPPPQPAPPKRSVAFFSYAPR